MPALQQTRASAPAGLRPVVELARGRAHGDRLRYLAGCRCADCRRVNSAYENMRSKARKAGDWNGLVPAGKARSHLAALSRLGVGYRAVADVADVSRCVLQKIINGQRGNIRALTERAILAVSTDAAADRANIPAGPTWALLDELIADGYSKAELARLMGYKTRALQIGRARVTVRNAYDVEKLHARLRFVDARPTLRRIAALEEEGFGRSLIVKRLAALAVETGAPPEFPPDLTVRKGRLRADTEALVMALYERLMN